MEISFKDLKELMSLVLLINKFSVIHRVVKNIDGTLETDTQHSYLMAVVSWYLISKHKLPLNLEKVLIYSLVHDLVEVYAGDVPAYEQTSDNRKTKKELEQQALERISQELPHFPDLTQYMKDYEDQSDPEGKFVRTLDKIIPILTIDINNDELVKKANITLEKYIDMKENIGRVHEDECIYNYYRVITKFLQDKGDFFFPDCLKKDFSSKEYDFSIFDRYEN